MNKKSAAIALAKQADTGSAFSIDLADRDLFFLP